MKYLFLLIGILLFLASQTELKADVADELCSIEGYTIIACSNVVGDFEGADYDKLIELDNGMIFRFQEYGYSYSYRPECIVFGDLYEYQGSEYIIYYLLIEDEVYSVTRVK